MVWCDGGECVLWCGVWGECMVECVVWCDGGECMLWCDGVECVVYGGVSVWCGVMVVSCDGVIGE